MLICDAQIHIWDEDRPDRPWPKDRGGKPQRDVPYLAPELIGLMDDGGIDRAVLVPPSWEGDYNDLAIQAVRDYPGRFAIMGRASVHQAESEPLFETWKQQPGMLGLRYTFHTPEQRRWLAEGTVDWLWAAAEKHGLHIMMLPPGQLDKVAGILERHPNLRITLDHAAIPSQTKDDAAFGHIPELCRMARYPNLAVKTSAFPCYTTEAYPYEGQLHDAVLRILDAFGSERTFWGTDITRSPISYRQHVELFTKHIPGIPSEVMGESLCKWLGWPL